MAFFDPTTIFTAISDVFKFGVAIAPALNAWIEAKIPAEKQHETKRRMAQCYRICKREKLTPLLMKGQVDLFFPVTADFTEEMQSEVLAIIAFRLK